MSRFDRYWLQLVYPTTEHRPARNLQHKTLYFWHVGLVTALSPCTAQIFVFQLHFYSSFFKKRYYLFLERGERRENVRERNIMMLEEILGSVASHMPRPGDQASALTGNRTGDLLACRPQLKLTKLHRSRHVFTFLEITQHNMLKMCIFFHLQ